MPVQNGRELARIQTNMNSCTSTFSQRACIEALTGPRTEIDRDARRVQEEARLHRQRSIRDTRIPLQASARRVLRVPERRCTGIDCESLPAGFSTRRASPALPARASASTATVSFASATPTRSRTSPRRYENQRTRRQEVAADGRPSPFVARNSPIACPVWPPLLRRLPAPLCGDIGHWTLDSRPDI